jgi:geranylgeranyl diphosphate synthase type II
MLACEACGGDVEQSLPAACAIEMVHTYSLIHDDLPAMDDDDLRRGRPTNHVVYGEATAILAGDGLLTLAFELLATHIQPAEVALGCVADLASGAGVVGMVGGQQADMESAQVVSEMTSEQTLQHLESIHRRKTGRLICAALIMGGRIAGADQAVLDSLKTYGEAVGLAFQIADDLLDVTGDAGKIGKGIGKDQEHGKLTYPGLLGIEESRQRAAGQVSRALEALNPLGERGWPLRELARYIIERDR